MNYDNYFYNCSKDYINLIDKNLYDTIITTIENLPTRNTQIEINTDLLIELTNKEWSYDSANKDFKPLYKNNRKICETSTTLNSNWHSDFAKTYSHGIVQIEVQFGKVELMFKDFCGFKIAFYERRLALGIEIVMYDPNKYFIHRKKAISGMAYFDIAKKTLPAIGLDCPIWLIGIKE